MTLAPIKVLIAIYVILFPVTMVYVVVNSFHFVRFRLPGDTSWALLTVYLLTVIGIVASSISLAIIAYNV